MSTSPYRLGFDVRGALADRARACEAEVFQEAFGDTPEVLGDAYGPYENSSILLTVTDADDAVVGFARLIVPGPAGLKTIVDLAGPPWHLDGAASAAAAGIDLDRTWDLATLGARAELGGYRRVVAAALYHGVIAATRANEVEWLVAMVDLEVRERLTMLGMVPHPLPGATVGPYLGSTSSLPTFVHVPTMIDDQRRRLPEAYRLIALGTGLDGIAVPPPEAFVHRRIDLADPIDLRDPAAGRQLTRSDPEG